MCCISNDICSRFNPFIILLTISAIVCAVGSHDAVRAALPAGGERLRASRLLRRHVLRHTAHRNGRRLRQHLPRHPGARAAHARQHQHAARRHLHAAAPHSGHAATGAGGVRAVVDTVYRLLDVHVDTARQGGHPASGESHSECANPLNCITNWNGHVG